VKTALVGGIGNVLLGDDAIAPYVVRLLDSLYTFADNVELVDLGTPALDLVHRIAGRHTVILIDSVSIDAPPGAVTQYRSSDILRHAPAPRLDPHSPALSECLLNTEFLGMSPQNFLLVGIVGASFEPGSPLTPAVAQAAPQAANIVLAELQRLGFSHHKKIAPREPDLWWAPAPPNAPHSTPRR